MSGLLIARELRAQLHGLTLWLLLAATALIISWLMLAQLQVYQEISPQLLAGQSSLGINDLVIAPTLNSLGLIVLLITPLLSMRALADERRSGRLQVLLASPLGIPRLLLGKWLGNALAAMLTVLVGLLIPATLSLGVNVELTRLLSAGLTLGLLVLAASAITLMFSAFARQGSSALAASYGLLLFLWLLDSITPSGSDWQRFALNLPLARGLGGSFDSGIPLYFLLLSASALLVAGVRLLGDRGGRARHRIGARLAQGLFALLLISCLGLSLRLSQQHTTIIFDNQPPPPQALLDALDALQGPLVITAYAPDFPLLRAQIDKLVAPLKQRYPDTTLRYVDPLRQPQMMRDLGIRRHGEITLEAMGRRQHLTSPDSASLLRAISQLARRGEPWIVALGGHGEAELHGSGNDGLGALAAQLEQLGFRGLSLDTRQQQQVPDNAALVLVAAPSRDYPAGVRKMLGDYLVRGGRVLWLHEQGNDAVLSELSGIRAAQPQPGLLAANVFEGSLVPPDEAQGAVVMLDSPRELQGADRAWQRVGALLAAADSENALGLALQRGQARIAVIGDSDIARNLLIGRADNQALLLQLINWLTDNKLATAPAADDIQINWSASTGALVAAFDALALPLLLLLSGVVIRRRRERA